VSGKAPTLRKAQSAPQIAKSAVLKTQATIPPELTRATAVIPTDERHRTYKEHRRKVLEVLSNPNISKVVSKLFNARVNRPNGRLSYDDLRKVLRDLDNQLGITFPTKAEKLFKRFDTNGDGALALEEFYELVVSSLRRLCFDRSSLIGREIFVSKQPGKVWDTFGSAKKIGSGTFGSAYLAKNRKTGEDRVVKAVKKSRAQLPVEDIEREIMVMLQIDHPNIVRLFKWYEDGHYIYLVMEALKGGTLQEVVSTFQQNGKALKEEWTRMVIRQAMEAMAYVHSLRLIHKDLKDENIMLLKKDPNYDEPFAIIIDLGIAEMFSKSDPTGKVVGGTPVTMAPEVWKGDFGPKCDVFSLGCIMFELLAGKYPFQAPSINPKDWLALHKRGPDWGAIRTTPHGVALCQLMLTYRDVDRPSMSDCLKHHWFEVKRQSLRKLSPEQYKSLQAFGEQTALKRAILLEIASRLPMEHAGRVIDVFRGFDANRDSSLSYQEIRDELKRAGILDEALLQKTFQAMDVDGDGILSFSEFAAGVMLIFKDLLDDRFLALFKEHDKDSDGYLNLEEAKSFLSISMDLARRGKRSQPKDVLSDIFHSGQKKISYNELRDRVLGRDD